MYACIAYACLVPMEARGGVQFPGTGVADSHELSFEYWG